jgi:hypothetical protein
MWAFVSMDKKSLFSQKTNIFNNFIHLSIWSKDPPKDRMSLLLGFDLTLCNGSSSM